MKLYGGFTDVERILRTFKIKKNVEVTDESSYKRQSQRLSCRHRQAGTGTL